MRLQYENIVEEEQVDKQVEKEFGIVTVAMGEGLKEMFASIGATTIIEGGQTMNPSTEDLLQAVENTNATYTYIVPNKDRKSTRLNSSHVAISYAVFCLKKKKGIPCNLRAHSDVC